MIRKSLLTLLLIATVLVSKAQTADEILAKYFENTGGLTNWKAVSTIKMEGKAAGPQGEIPFMMQMKTPNKSKVTFNVQGKEFVQAAYDGETAWSLNPFAGGTDPVKLDADATKELHEEEVESAFIDYKKKGHSVTLEGKEEIEGVQCFKIKLEKNKNNDKDDVTEIHYFDSENYVPIMIKRYLRSGPGKGTEVQAFMSDYQEVNGLMMPYSLEQKVGGQSAGKLVMTKITINDKIEDTVFAYPKK